MPCVYGICQRWDGESGASMLTSSQQLQRQLCLARHLGKPCRLQPLFKQKIVSWMIPNAPRIACERRACPTTALEAGNRWEVMTFGTRANVVPVLCGEIFTKRKGVIYARFGRVLFSGSPHRSKNLPEEKKMGAEFVLSEDNKQLTRSRRPHFFFLAAGLLWAKSEAAKA